MVGRIARSLHGVIPYQAINTTSLYDRFSIMFRTTLGEMQRHTANHGDRNRAAFNPFNSCHDYLPSNYPSSLFTVMVENRVREKSKNIQ